MARKNTNVIDIDLSVTKKKQFRIDGDDSRIIELNTSDMLIIERLNEVYPKLESLSAKTAELSSDDIDGGVKALKDIDKEMRELLDYSFDSPISSACAPDGSMYDLFNGEFRFEHIITVLLNLYEENITKEFNSMEKRINKHTAKYTKK